MLNKTRTGTLTPEEEVAQARLDADNAVPVYLDPAFRDMGWEQQASQPSEVIKMFTTVDERPIELEVLVYNDPHGRTFGHFKDDFVVFLPSLLAATFWIGENYSYNFISEEDFNQQIERLTK